MTRELLDFSMKRALFSLLLLLAVAPASHAAHFSFHGEEEGIASQWPGPAIVVQGEGSAKRFGAYAITLWLAVAPGVLTGTGTGTWSLTLASGEQIWGTADVEPVIVYGNPYTIKWAFLLVTGGSGPLRGAAGWLTWQAEFEQANGTLDPYYGTLIGSFSTP